MRYAGDIFSKPMAAENNDESELIGYFPELKNFDRRISGEARKGAKTTGGFEAIDPFTGFKTFEQKTEYAAVPKFAAFKPFERQN